MKYTLLLRLMTQVTIMTRIVILEQRSAFKCCTKLFVAGCTKLTKWEIFEVMIGNLKVVKLYTTG